MIPLADAANSRIRNTPLEVSEPVEPAIAGQTAPIERGGRYRHPGAARVRSGWTLVECVVVMAAAATLLPVATTALVHLITLQRAIAEEGLLIQSSLDVSQAFHEDWQSSTAAEPLDEDNRVEPALPGRGLRLILTDDTTVQYQLEGSIIVRTVSNRGRLVRRDGYRLPPRTDVTFVIDNIANLRVGNMVISPVRRLKSDRAGRELRVTAIRPESSPSNGVQPQ